MHAANTTESIVTIVGFLGAGKTTLLRHLVESFLEKRWDPYVILNDYMNADLDAQQISVDIMPRSVKALTGSCICCDGIGELRDCVNSIPARRRGITLIEANGTSDACTLMGFLGVGLEERFMPPVQVSVVDVKNWQKRGFHNELEAEQLKVSSLILFTHLEGVSKERVAQVDTEVRKVNPLASIVTKAELDVLLIPKLKPIEKAITSLDHNKAHWSSCSIDLPDLPNVGCINDICDSIPRTILRIKGCTRVGHDEGYTYFERCPDGQVYIRPYVGSPRTGPKLLTVGPGSEPILLHEAVARSLEIAESRLG
ncbi:MAG: GTP-binding protein [Arenicellales bacterium]|nr:GTP-binding protein [Arenicellales bacterium]